MVMPRTTIRVGVQRLAQVRWALRSSDVPVRQMDWYQWVMLQNSQVTMGSATTEMTG